MKDFTLQGYKELISRFRANGYIIIPCKEMDRAPDLEGPVLILRHDVDDHPGRALAMAEMERGMGVSSSYYFRYRPKLFQEEIIRQIHALGHEIGYHYENLSDTKGDRQKATRQFEEAIRAFRRICPVETISPHGSPLSRFNNRLMWEAREYRKWGIHKDISIDTDFSRILYLTETGRSWNSPYNRRDKVKSAIRVGIRKTADLIRLLENQEMPDLVMMNVHPQRWTDNIWAWHWEKWAQAQKNWVKYVFFQRSENSD